MSSSSACRSPTKVPVRTRRSETSASTPTDNKKMFAPVVEVNVVRNHEHASGKEHHDRGVDILRGNGHGANITINETNKTVDNETNMNINESSVFLGENSKKVIETNKTKDKGNKIIDKTNKIIGENNNNDVDSCSSINDSRDMSRDDQVHQISKPGTTQFRNGSEHRVGDAQSFVSDATSHQHIRADEDLACNNAADQHIRVYGDHSASARMHAHTCAGDASVTDTSMDGGCPYAFNTNMYDFVEVSACQHAIMFTRVCLCV
jgi:hypothetical protein